MSIEPIIISSDSDSDGSMSDISVNPVQVGDSPVKVVPTKLHRSG